MGSKYTKNLQKRDDLIGSSMDLNLKDHRGNNHKKEEEGSGPQT